jgi:hypothetical protein
MVLGGFRTGRARMKGVNMRTVTATLDTEFAASREHFDSVVGFLKGDDAAGLQHGQLEEHLAQVGRELIRLLQ